MTPAILARRAVWDLFKNAAAHTTGFASPLYGAALRARLGRDPAGEEFAALAARLPSKDRRRLWARVRALNTERAGSERAA